MLEAGNQDKIIELLIKYGWAADGHSFSSTYKMITQSSYPLAGAIVHAGGKPRFKSPCGKYKVSVGKRTTYFYEPIKDVDYWKWPGDGFATKNVDEIEEHLKSLTPANGKGKVK